MIWVPSYAAGDLGPTVPGKQSSDKRPFLVAPQHPVPHTVSLLDSAQEVIFGGTFGQERVTGGEQEFKNRDEGIGITKVVQDFTGDTTEEEYEDEDDQGGCNNGNNGGRESKHWKTDTNVESEDRGKGKHEEIGSLERKYSEIIVINDEEETVSERPRKHISPGVSEVTLIFLPVPEYILKLMFCRVKDMNLKFNGLWFLLHPSRDLQSEREGIQPFF